jgi:hypothetical protein
VTDPLNTQLTALTADLGVPQDVSDLITKALTSDGVTTVGLRVGEEALRPSRRDRQAGAPA